VLFRSAAVADATTGLPAGCWPTTWPTDSRDGGVPDPRTAGPKIIQIDSEGGFLPAPVEIPSQPVGYNYNRRDIVVLNVQEHGLYLGPAERADVVVDFSQYAGQTLILYNDSPAPVPAFDPRVDYYTGDPDNTSTGGAPTTLPGLGPNTRTIMQIRVAATTPDPAYSLTALQAAFKSTATTQGAFEVGSDPILVPENVPGYVSAYNLTTPPADQYARIQSNYLTFTPLGTTTPLTLDLKPKAIQELFELGYGRMNATLGVELPFTNGMNQTTVPLGYIDPTTERLTDSVTIGVPTGTDGTQLWKITHNGVDTHAIHVHLFNAQVINRVGWDGAVRPPDPQELGWKETIKMNPLEDIILAVRPVAPKLPFGVPVSKRSNDVTQLPSASFQSLSPLDGGQVTVSNANDTDFGWEYVWHCHLLGHEENDMMRPLVLDVAVTTPAAPTSLTSTLAPSAVNLAWGDPTPVTSVTNPATIGNVTNEIGFIIERQIGRASCRERVS
jgi:FtsP/CotA-like multicopper oxidase with cupredoxin domain